MYLPELGLPFDESLAKAKEIGADCVWFNTLGTDGPSMRDLDDAAVDRVAEQVAGHGLEIFLINVGNPFKQIHLTDLDLDGMEENPEFRQDMDDMVRSMQIAARLGVGAVGVFTFAWPGEYSAAKPTWPMRWLTRGRLYRRRRDGEAGAGLFAGAGAGRKVRCRPGAFDDALELYEYDRKFP